MSSNSKASSPPSVTSLVLAGTIGAVAATALTLGLQRWRGQTCNQSHQHHLQTTSSSSNETLNIHLSPFQPSPSSQIAATSTASSRHHLNSDDVGHEFSRSGARKGSVSRIGSDASYLEENEYEGDHHRLSDELDDSGLGQQQDQENGDEDQPRIWQCPHCSNYINEHELIVPSYDEDDQHDADDTEAARILSAAEQLSIQLALKDSLYKIFQSVDEDNDGIITREEMGEFLKKLGLTGDREQAFLNIVGGDTVQNLPSPIEPQSAPPSNSNKALMDVKRGSDGGATSETGVANGINFKQFLDRFQDTLVNLDEIDTTANPAEIGIPTVQVPLDPNAKFEPISPNGLDNSPPATTPASSPTHLFTPPRSTTNASANSRLTVNTLTTPNGSILALPSTTSDSSSSALSPTFQTPSHSPAPTTSPVIRVFLGGACGETTWRKVEAIPQFVKAGITFYDPQVKEWSSKLVALEGLMKAWCKILFFVIGAKTRALASMIEVASLIAAGRRVVLVIEPVEAGVEIEGQIPSASELKDLNRARDYLRDVASNYNIQVHATADAGIKAIIAQEEEERQALQRARLSAMHHNGSRGSISISNSARARGRSSIISPASPLISPNLKKSASISSGSTHPPPNLLGTHHSHSLSMAHTTGGGGHMRHHSQQYPHHSHTLSTSIASPSLRSPLQSSLQAPTMVPESPAHSSTASTPAPVIILTPSPSPGPIEVTPAEVIVAPIASPTKAIENVESTAAASASVDEPPATTAASTAVPITNGKQSGGKKKKNKH